MTTAAEAIINAFLPVAERAVTALERWLDGAEIGIVDDVPVMVTHKRPDQTWEEAVTEAEREADSGKKPWVTPELIQVTVERSRGGDSSKPVTDPQGASVTDSEPEPDAVPSADGLTVAELDALPAWSVVDATGGERWFVKTLPDGDYWFAIGERECKPAAELIADEGPIRLECRAPGPDQIVIKRDERWHPGYLRLGAAELDVCGHKSAAGAVRTVADALEQEGR